MNTKQILMTMAIAALLPVSIALAEEDATSATVEAQQGQKFEERKAEALQKLDNAAAKIQKKRECVQASTDGKSLKACFPNAGKRGGRGDRDGEDSAQ